MLAAAATHTERDLRAGALATFPHAAAALGRLFSFDTLHLTPLPDSTTAVRLVFAIHPDRLAATYPHYAAYIAKYVGRSRAHSVLLDRDSTPWFDLAIEHNRVTLAFRATRDGHFAPATGTPRPIQDSLLLRTDFHTRAWIFGVGMSDLIASFTVLDDAHERGWLLRFRQEPSWHFPPLVEHLIKSPLRRPFMGDGARLRISVRDSTGAHTLLTRDGRLAMQESGIASWLGGLGGNALAALEGQTDVELNAYFAEIFSALSTDIEQQPASAPAGP